MTAKPETAAEVLAEYHARSRESADPLEQRELSHFMYRLERALSARAAVPDEGLRKLVTQWRHNAQGCGRRDQHAAGTWRSCARELEGVLAAAPQPAGEVVQTQAEQPRPMETAPRDGTMVRLLVDFDEHDVEDGPEPSWTVGVLASDEPDAEWQFAGWCWTHDHFTEGKGKPIGWLPMLSEPAPSAPADVEALIQHHEMWVNDARESGHEDAVVFHTTCLDTIRRLSGAQQAEGGNHA